MFGIFVFRDLRSIEEEGKSRVGGGTYNKKLKSFIEEIELTSYPIYGDFLHPAVADKAYNKALLIARFKNPQPKIIHRIKIEAPF